MPTRRSQLTTMLLLLGVVSLAACSGGSKKAAPAAAGGPPGPTGTGVIAGRVAFEGTVPPPQRMKVTEDCVGASPDGVERQPLRVQEGGLAEVVVYVKSGISGSYPVPAQPVTLDQKGCDYHPHILALQAGQSLKMVNSDPTLHNVHPRPMANDEFNIGQPKQGMETTRTFDVPEMMIPVGCDVHPWMRAWVSVLPHPFFAVTKPDGSFEIKGLPPGEYEIEALHQKLKGQTSKVTVKDGAPAVASFTFKG